MPSCAMRCNKWASPISLDFVSRREVFLLLQRLAHEQGKAILLSTHEIALADTFADTIWLFDEGQLKIKNQS